MNPFNSASTWAGGITAGLLYEWFNPVIAWLIQLASNALQACCSTPMPDVVQQALSAMVVALVVGLVIHFVPDKLTGSNTKPTPPPA